MEIPVIKNSKVESNQNRARPDWSERNGYSTSKRWDDTRYFLFSSGMVSNFNISEKKFFLKILLLLTAIPATVAQWVNCSSFYRYFTCCLKLKNIIRILAPDRRHLSSFFCFLGGSKKNLWNLFAKFVHITQISIKKKLRGHQFIISSHITYR